jgi:hypothetical protein
MVEATTHKEILEGTLFKDPRRATVDLIHPSLPTVQRAVQSAT